ncbi:unnamed protein product [Meloidogyne enterolobii]|uniref:Uncharacterized protein n=1 Tax=Meloidogyne enterolobii TaxID=390850 RepID=A0ACB1AYB6_MELEN
MLLGNLSILAEFHPILLKHFNGFPIMNVAVEMAKELDKLANGKSEEKPSKESLNSLRVNIYRLERLCDSWLNTGHYSNVPDRLRLLYSFLCALLAKLDFLCEDYMHRLHQNSQLLSPSKTNDDLTNINENPINKVFESSQNNEEKNKTKKIIKLKLTKKFIKKIGQLFDEEEENEEEEKENELLNNEIEIPLWLCEMFYKAIHFGVSIPNEKIIEGEEEEVIPTKT